MTKLNIATLPNSIKRQPKVLKQWFAVDNYEHFETLTDPKISNIDVFVQTNLIKHKFLRSKISSYEFIIRSGKPKLVVESSMFRSIKTEALKLGILRLGWNSYQYHNADFNNTNSPPDRWNFLQKKYSIDVNEWKTDGEYILFTLQKPGDSSLQDITLNREYNGYWGWVEKTAKEIRKYTDRKIILRPHINQQDRGYAICSKIAEKIKNCSVSENYHWHKSMGASGGSGLQQDLKHAWCTITYNSLSSVESVLAGVPVIVLHKGAMTYPVAHHSLKDIENLNRNIDISQWLYDSAYTSWTYEELRSGKAWDHLRPRYSFWKNKTQQQLKENVNRLEDLKQLWMHQL